MRRPFLTLATELSCRGAGPLLVRITKIIEENIAHVFKRKEQVLNSIVLEQVRLLVVLVQPRPPPSLFPFLVWEATGRKVETAHGS